MEKIEELVKDVCDEKDVDVDEFRVAVEVLRPRAGDVLVAHIVSDAVDAAVCSKVRQHLERAVGAGVHVATFGYSEDDAVQFLALSPKEIKLLGRCPKCAVRGAAHAGALVCPIHGAYTG